MDYWEISMGLIFGNRTSRVASVVPSLTSTLIALARNPMADHRDRGGSYIVFSAIGFVS